MTIELKEGRYFAAMWFVGGTFKGQPQDWLCAMYRDGNGPWTVKYRFRYHKDARVFNSEDIKRWYVMTAPINSSPREVEELCGNIAELNAARLHADVETLRLHTSDQEIILNAMRKASFMNFEAEPCHN